MLIFQVVHEPFSQC